MAINRRQFGIGLSSLAIMGGGSGRADAHGRPAYLTTARDRLTGRFLAVALNEDLSIAWETPLQGRGHGPVLSPLNDRGVFVARRPQTFASVLEVATGDTQHEIVSLLGRHFCGHGVYSADGRYLYLTENAYEIGAGVIGVYDTHDRYQRIDEFSSGGIGPHEIILMPDGNTLCVANGGIRTHPDRPREKLNIDTMRSNVQMIDAATGRIGAAYRPEGERQQKLSLRHIATRSDGLVIVGAQDEGDVSDDLPLAYVTDDEKLHALPVPRHLQKELKGYIGSVASDPVSNRLAASAPRGGRILSWRTDGEFENAATLPDGCGIAYSSEQLAATNGKGDIQRASNLTSHPFRQWDNHLINL